MNRLRKRVLIAAALFACCAGQASATDFDPSDLTASQILANAHKAAGTLEPGTYQIVSYTWSAGLLTKSTTQERGDDSVTTEQTAGFMDSFGVYLGQSWSQNSNGIVLLGSGFHDATDPNVLALKHPDDSRYNVKALGITADSPHEYVVESNPPNGFDELRYYSTATGLLDRVVATRKGYHSQTTLYGDYRRVFGKMRAFHVQVSFDGEPQDNVDTHVVSFTTTALTMPLVPPKSKPLFTFPNGKPIVLPATFSPAGVIVRATIAGRGLDFLLDSGADGLVIDPGVAHDLGLKTYGRSTATIGGDIDVSMARVPQIQIGSLTLDNVAFNVSPLSWETGRARIVGLLGCDLIASAVVGIDFKKQTVTLYPEASFDPRSFGLKRQFIQVDDGVPRTMVSFENVPASVLLDTGAYGSIGYDAYVKTLPSVDHTRHWGSFGAVGGEVLSEFQIVSDLSFGGILFQKVPLMVPTDANFDTPQYDGLLGRDVLSHYLLFFDYANNALYLKPNI